MVIPMEITFRHMGHSRSVEEAVRHRGEKLDQFYPRITSCRVLVETLHHKQGANGLVYHVRVDVIVPGGELVGQREPPRQHFHEDVFIAVRDAFDEVEREVKDYARMRRGSVKTHEPRPHGRVVRLFPERGYGFLESEDGYDVYFHEHSVLDRGFTKLAVGAEVRFEEELGDNGPQATTVALLGKGGRAAAAAAAVNGAKRG